MYDQQKKILGFNFLADVGRFFRGIIHFSVTCLFYCRFWWFLAHLSRECSVSYCDHSPSVSVRLSVHYILVDTLASTNINQLAPNLVKMYMTIRSHMSLITEVIGPELSELSAFELEKLPYLTLFTL